MVRIKTSVINMTNLSVWPMQKWLAAYHSDVHGAFNSKGLDIIYSWKRKWTVRQQKTVRQSHHYRGVLKVNDGAHKETSNVRIIYILDYKGQVHYSLLQSSRLAVAKAKSDNMGRPLLCGKDFSNLMFSKCTEI